MIRFLSVICGIAMVIVMAGVAPAQSQGALAVRRRGNHLQPPDPQTPAPTTTAGQFQPATLVQEPAVQPARPPQTTPPPPTAGPSPVAPPTAEHLPPPTPAVVTYQNGLLTVQAMNSTLGGLLAAIRNKTGIQFEGLEGGAPERVAIAMGPAPESEVLAAILGGSSFDYVVLGRPDSPGIVQRVLLMPRGGATPAVAGAQPPRPAANAGGDDEDSPDEQASGDPEPQDQPARPPVTQAQPQQPDQQPKTPEQLMQQLQQMQQQRQQQLQQQQQQQQQQPVPPQNQAPIKPPTSPQ